MFDHQDRKKRSNTLDEMWYGGLKFKGLDQNKAAVLYSSSKRQILIKLRR